jgi:prolipoprotein diacylglyceryl transferase
MLASIPSPSDNSINIGGLELRAYGLAIALGVIAAVWIARRRWAARGGDPDDISRIALWAVLAGLIGARLYHVLTDLDRFEGRWLHVFAIWEGGLGIPGGLIAGVGTGAFIAHRRDLPVAELLDVVAPALPVAQAIGRLGNWFNQELFGRPTDLPWGLEIDPQHRPAGYLDVATFHPTFLYEALWNLALAGGLVLWERHHPGARAGRLFALYVAGYAVGRAWVEALRIDPAAHLFGVRWNIWMSAIAFFAAVGWLIFDSWRARREAEQQPSVAAKATDEATEEAADVAEADRPTAVAAATDAAEPAEEPTSDEAATDATEPAQQDDADEAAASAAPPTTVAAATDATEPGEQADADGEPADATERAEQVDADEAAASAAQPTTDTADADEDDEAADATEPGEHADADDVAAATEKPGVDEPAAAGTATSETDDTTAAEPVTEVEQADAATEQPADRSAATAGTAGRPAGPADDDAGDDESAGDQPVAASTESDSAAAAEPESGPPPDPEPGTSARPQTADEEAPT